jgi:purine-nucleoside phosphorylase
MTTCLINPFRKKDEPELAPFGILAVNPSDCTSFANLGKLYALKRHGLFHADVYHNASFFLAGPAVGAPMAVLILEKLIALGARKILVYGWCGSIHSSLRIGELFSPTGEGLSEEGTSSHYPLSSSFFDLAWQAQAVELLSNAGLHVHQGPIWTTDAPFRETRDKVELYGSQGVLAVDMEYTALRTVAAFRKVSLVAVMKVSDELFHREWTPRFQYKRFMSDSRQLLRQLCLYLHEGELV